METVTGRRPPSTADLQRKCHGERGLPFTGPDMNDSSHASVCANSNEHEVWMSVHGHRGASAFLLRARIWVRLQGCPEGAVSRDHCHRHSYPGKCAGIDWAYAVMPRHAAQLFTAHWHCSRRKCNKDTETRRLPAAATACRAVLMPPAAFSDGVSGGALCCGSNPKAPPMSRKACCLPPPPHPGTDLHG